MGKGKGLCEKLHALGILFGVWHTLDSASVPLRIYLSWKAQKCVCLWLKPICIILSAKLSCSRKGALWIDWIFG